VTHMPIKQIKNILSNSLSKLKPKVSIVLNNTSKSTFDFIDNFSIRRRLILFFLLASLVPIFIIGIISYTSSKGAIDSKIKKYSQKELSQTVLNLQMKLQGVENTSMQFIANSQYNTIIKEYCDAKDVDQVTKRIALYNLLLSISMSNKDDYTIAFMNINDPSKFVVSGTSFASGSPLANSLNSFLNNLKSKFFRQVIDGNGSVVWSPVKLANNSNYIVMGREIKDGVMGEAIGIMTVFINEKVLSDVANSITDTETDQNMNDSYSMIINSQGAIISSPFIDDIGKNISNLLDHPKKLKPLLTGEKDNDSFPDKMKRQNVLVTCKTIGDRGWYILSVAKTSYLYLESRMVGWITLGLGIFFGMIAIFISIYIAMSISNPLNQVVNSMRQAENGDFTVRVNVKRKDELGFLGASFDHMIEKIGNLLKETKEAIDAVLDHSTILEESSYQSAKTAEVVAAAMEEISKGTMEQTTETEKSSVKMTDLATQIETVVTKAAEVEKISGSTRDLSLKSKDAVDQLINKTNETDQITETIIKDIVDLNKSAEAIRDITAVITGIAEQTNLLGLNASIEAARAGEMGQGFAVVSEEVNKLAIQSRDAAKTINNILKTIEIKTQNSSKTAKQAHQIIEEQRNAVTFAQEAFAEITTATGDIIARIIFMNHLINNINSNKEHTVQSILNISSISEQTAASAQEVSASTEEQTALSEQVRMLSRELRGKAKELAETIAKFQV
jgi:methyl-accepting chemotaxis protein